MTADEFVSVVSRRNSFDSPGFKITGPDFGAKDYYYPNAQPAGNLWYHDNTLGITRLTVYSGLAGFYFIRDDRDTGNRFNKLGLPYGDFEKAYLIQDRMFKTNGELFFPAYPGEPLYDNDFPDLSATPFDTCSHATMTLKMKSQSPLYVAIFYIYVDFCLAHLVRPLIVQQSL
jgi:FtsP/CotA-like multicopper oxidase with cupredoxin domain